MLHHIHYLDKKATSYLGNAVVGHFLKDQAFTDIVVVCIGTKRCSGDSLGPLVGTQLFQKFSHDNQVHIYGTFEKPVHALNLQKTMSSIEKEYHRPYIIAVDACLGRYYKIGTLQLVEGPLQPGVSLEKELPSVGNIHLKGIVNNFGLLNYQVLENTSLTHVKEMADVLSRVLISASTQLKQHLVSKPVKVKNTTASSS